MGSEAHASDPMPPVPKVRGEIKAAADEEGQRGRGGERATIRRKAPLRGTSPPPLSFFCQPLKLKFPLAGQTRLCCQPP